MKILAIDASSKNTGIAIFQNSKLIKYDCITAAGEDFINRINKMVKKIRQIYDQYSPDQVVIEEVLPNDVKHNQQVYKVLIYLQAAIVMELHKSNAKIHFMVASHWRSLCGIRTGQTKRQELKQASQNIVKQLYHIDVNDDISDAICIGIAFLVQNKPKSAF